MKGKNKCKILKEIRRQIARENDISYVTAECKYQGDCTGTCPKCESEVRYLEEQLDLRRRAGKAVALSGIATALLVSNVGCTAIANMTESGENPKTTSSYQETTNMNPLMGDPIVYDTDTTAYLVGETMPPEQTDTTETTDSADITEVTPGEVPYDEPGGITFEADPTMEVPAYDD